MKKGIFKTLLLSAAALLLLAPMTVNVAASAASITDYTSGSAAPATKEWGKYTKYVYTETDGKQALFYGEYKPSDSSDYEFVVHDIRNSNGDVKLSTVAAIAADYEAKTGRAVKMATNGDFFDSTGESIDSLVKDGEVIKTGAYTNKNAFGFDNNGNAVAGRVTETKDVLQVALDGVTYRIDIDKENMVPGENELSLYTTAQGMAIEGCKKYKVKLEGTSTILTTRPLNGTCSVSVAADKDLTLSTGQFALVVKEGSKLADFLSKSLKYGAEVKILKAPAGEFEGMDYVVGGWDILVEDGEIVPSTHSTTSDPNGGGYNAPRTFIGMKADGTMFLAVIDGRQSSHSVGCTVAEEGRLALALGAEIALELDGGGSSTFMFDLGDGLTTLNKPSDGSARAVSNAILLVEKDKEDSGYATIEDYIYVEEGDDPSDNPDDNPNDEPTDNPNDEPTENPSDNPSDKPSDEPTTSVHDNSTNEGGGNGGVTITNKSGCFSSVQGLSIAAGACLVCGISLIKKKKGDK